MRSLYKLVTKIVRWRYLLAIIVFSLSVLLELHGSSVANWVNFGISETTSGTQMERIDDFSSEEILDWETIGKNWISFPPGEDGTILGTPRMIRSDEWLVQTPFILSQVNTGNQLVNPSYGYSGMNMVVAYNSPVKDISAIGKPFNWGFLFLGATKGMAWYWSFKLIGLCLLAYEFSMILTKGNRFLSTISSIWITFTPVVQWWFMQHLGDVVFFTLGIIVFIYHYFNTQNKWKKLGMAMLLGSFLIGFTLVIYPAFQVPFAYIFVFFFILEFYKSFKQKTLHLFDWFMIATTIAWSGGVLIWTIIRSWDALSLTLNTVYPGSRISVGGGYELKRVTELFVNFLLPYKAPYWTNQVEAATSISLFPILLPIIPFLVKKKHLKTDQFGIFLVLFSLFLAVFSMLGLPEFLSKISLFSFVTSSRSWQALAVVSVFASIWMISIIWEEKNNLKFHRTVIILGLVALLFLVYGALTTPQILGFVGPNYILLFGLLLSLIVIAVFYKLKTILAVGIIGLSLFAGATVNPLVQGLEMIESKSLSYAIKNIVAKDAEAIWASEGMLYNYPQIFGAHTINSVRFYPDTKLMAKIDEKNEFENAWNRYAHMRFELIQEDSEMSVGIAEDILEMRLNIAELKNMKVKYILTNRNLEELFPNQFQLLYVDSDYNRIYQLVD